MILYEDMETVITIQWNRLNTFCFIRYAFFLTWCAHANTCLYIIEHMEVADELITSKNPDLTWFFIIKTRHPGRLKKQIWVEKTRSGSPAWSRAEKRLLP